MALEEIQTCEPAQDFMVYETPIKVPQVSPELQTMQSLKTDLQSASSSRGDLTLTTSSEQDVEEDSASDSCENNFSSFLDDLCGPF